MGEITSYPVFEADQVLSADHLNKLFQYLDEENRLTRTRLIGIGIVCGEDTSYNSSNASITITKGVGVTSMGYLIRFPEGTTKNLNASSVTYTHYRTYTLPEGAKVKQAAYASWTMKELVEAKEVKTGDLEIKGLSALSNYVVVLFLEYNEIDLKNCTTNDCDDKGKKVELTVRPLLVLKTDLQKFNWNDIEAGKETLPDLILKRYNVPFTPLKTPTDVLSAFHSVSDSQTIKNIADAYNEAYNVFKPVIEGTNPFSTLNTTLTTTLNSIKSTNVIHSQYFVDFIEDLVKAYYELREIGYLIISECCPDENRFPFHLMLGEANQNSANSITSYRHYFVHSPLFDVQYSETKQLLLLFEKMKKLVASFKLPTSDEALKIPIKITPSLLGREPLSSRAIPYYYDQKNELYKSWSFEKAKRNRANTNLSYNAKDYNNTNDYVINPLKYDIEPYNFFRIEGHIGKNYKDAVGEIVKQRSTFNLPIDVVALNVRKLKGEADAKTAQCYFQDLESLYNVVISELLCKIHHPICFLAKLPYVDLSQFVDVGNLASGKFKLDTNTFSEAFKGVSDDLLSNTTAAPKARKLRVSSVYMVQQKSFVDSVRDQDYKKGVFLKEFCAPKEKTVGAEYLRRVGLNQSAMFLPTNLASGNNNIILTLQLMYGHFIYFIDTAEEMLKSILPYNLGDFDFENFEIKYNTFIKEAKDLGVLMVLLTSRLEELYGKTTRTKGLLDDAESALMSIIIDEIQMLTHLCIDEQLHTLKAEYEKRLSKLQLDKWFAYYSTMHPGVEHKAGVPKGGTFIMVYEEGARVSTEQPPRVLSNAIEAPAAEFEGAVMMNTSAYDKAYYVNPTDHIVSETYSDEAANSNVYTRKIMKEYVDKEKSKWTEQEVMEAEKVLKIFEAKAAEYTLYEVEERAVFADFYLPYLCCSDCAPLSYIIQENKPDPVNPTITIDPDEFCNSDDGIYKIVASPAGGKVSGKGVDPKKFEFTPFELEENTHTITYDLNGVLATTTVKVYAPKTAEFEYKVNQQADGSFLIQLAAKESNASKYEWYIDDDIVPRYTNSMAIHKVDVFDGEEKTIKIILKVTNGPCSIQDHVEEILLQKQITEVTEKRAICFIIKYMLEPQLPAGSKVDIVDNGGLAISSDLIIELDPKKITSTKTFIIKYKITDTNGVVVNKTLELTVIRVVTSFVIEYKDRQNNPNAVGELGDYILTAEDKNPSIFDWEYIIETTGQMVAKQGNPLIVPRNNDGIDPFTVTLRVKETALETECGAENKVSITAEAMRIMLQGRKFRGIEGKLLGI